MAKGLMGKKIGMLQIYDEAGNNIAVTALEAGPCVVTQVKKEEKDGYSALQIAYDEKRKKLFSKPEIGHQKKAVGDKEGCFRHLKEVRGYFEEKKIGDEINCNIFEAGEKIIVQGISKGKGFQGVVKRYNFSGGRESHGSTFHRDPGAIGAGTSPGEVRKGQRLPGRMGGKKKSIRNVEVVKILSDEKVLLVKGSVPGPSGSLVYLYSK
ncbi:MAG: 50S ribosomal protein L3 [Spirochaetia bacterium]|nr:50S ribosomal protein L3 [Spirochaetia bacterium]